MNRGTQVVGMAYFYLLEDAPVSYLTYLAIEKDLRRKKLGPQLPPLSEGGKKMSMYLMMLSTDEKAEPNEMLASKITNAIHRQICPDYWKSQMSVDEAKKP